jgi:hypothetical protein
VIDWNSDDKGRNGDGELVNQQRIQDFTHREDGAKHPVYSRAKPDKDLTDIEWFEEVTFDIYTEGWHLLLKKHKDYGPKNIALAPGGALNGLRVRIWDKIARINHLVDNGADAQNESLRDSFVDLMNYAAIAQLVLDKKWPSE